MDWEVRKAVESYAGQNYWKINNGLRKGKNPKIAQHLDRALTPLQEDVTVYRGIRDLAEVNGSPIVGSEITQLGFLSTSLDHQFDFQIARKSQVHLTLDVPAGTLGLYVADMIGWASEREQELLLERGLTWKITDVKLHKFRKAFEQHTSKLYRIRGEVICKPITRSEHQESFRSPILV